MLNRVLDQIRKNHALFFVIILAFFFRFWRLSQMPPSLNWDEVSHGYNAFSILKTGKDEWGNFLPVIFRAYGDYKLPVYIYLTSISEFFFGLTPFSVRFISALSGVGTVILTYFLVIELFKDFKLRFSVYYLALMSALLTAVEPWSLFLSRAAFEANLALFLFVAGIYFFLRFLNSPATYYSLLTSIFLGLTVWTYNSYRIFTPLMLIALSVIYKKELLRLFKANYKTIAYCLLPIAFFLIPMFWQLSKLQGMARYEEVRILDEGMIASINEARSKGGQRIIHNKVTYFLGSFSKNYISHFSPKFLFYEGGSNYQFSVPGEGILYPINLLFIVIGLLIIIKRSFKNNQSYRMLLFWLLLAPIPSSLTREAPHILRNITMLPIPMILSALGFYYVANIVQSKRPVYYLLSTIYLIILTVQLGNYLKIYFYDYAKNFSWSWQYENNKAAEILKGYYPFYDKIIMTKKYGEPHEFILFHLGWNPDKFQNDPNLIRFHQSNWYWVDAFDKFYFVNDWDIPSEEWQKFKLESSVDIECVVSKIHCLLITSPGNVPKGWIKREMIKYLDGKAALELYDNYTLIN